MPKTPQSCARVAADSTTVDATDARRHASDHNDGRVRTRDAASSYVTYPVAVTWMRKRDHNIFANAASLLICGLLAGVVVAAAAFPAVAMSGLAAKAGGETFAQLPSELDGHSARRRSRYVYASDGKTLLAHVVRRVPQRRPAEGHPADHAERDRRRRGPRVLQAQRRRRQGRRPRVRQPTSRPASPAGRLHADHAVRAACRSPTRRPARRRWSTPPRTPRKRKIAEMKYALQVEKELTKDADPRALPEHRAVRQRRVRHLRGQPGLLRQEAEGPDGRRGRAAGRHGQGADRVRPDHRRAATRRPSTAATTCSTRCVELGCITAGAGRRGQAPTQGHAARSSAPATAASRSRRTTGASSATSSTAGGWSQEAFGATAYDRERRLKSGGYRIVTSLDIKAQDAARERIVEQHLKTSNKNALMLAGIEPGTGQVRALAANRKFKLDDPTNPQNKISSNPAKAKQKIRGTYPNTTNPLLSGGGDITGYQAGSVFKMFTMVAALEKGYPLDYTINARAAVQVELHRRVRQPGRPAPAPTVLPAELRRRGRRRRATCGPASAGRSTRTSCRCRSGSARRTWSTWPSGSASSSARRATPSSPTTRTPPPVGRVHPRRLPSTPLEMANAYATLAARRQVLRADPGRRRSRDQNGEKLDVANPRCKQAIDPTWPARPSTRPAARSATSRQLGRCNGAHRPRRPAASSATRSFGKTGTTDERQDRGADRRHHAAGGRRLPGQPGLGRAPRPACRTTSSTRRSTRRCATHGGQADRIEFKTPDNRKIAFGEQRSHPERRVRRRSARPRRGCGAPASRSSVAQQPGRLDVPGRHGRPAPARAAAPSRAAS